MGSDHRHGLRGRGGLATGQINVEWFKDNPEAIARMERKRRQLGALSQVAGGVTTDVQRYGAFRQSEDLAEARQAQLAERLNYADAQARASGRPLEEGQTPPTSAMSPGMLGPTPPAPSGGSAAAPSSTAPSTQPSSIREEPLGPSKRSGPIGSLQTPPVSGLPEEGGLSKFARTAAATIFGANIPRSGRAVTSGRLFGQVQRRQDELLALKAMNPLWRYAVNPAASMRQIAPDWNIPDTERMPPGSFSRITPSTMALQASGGDPAKALQLMGYPRGGGAADMTTTSTVTPLGPGGQPFDPTSLDAILSGGRPAGRQTVTTKKRDRGGAGSSAGGDLPSGSGGMSDDERQLRKELGLGE